MVKRTRQLDRAKEVLIRRNRDGSPVWTTVGDMEMTPDQKAQLSHNLRARQRHAVVAKMAEECFRKAERVLIKTFVDLAPENVLRDFDEKGEDGQLFREWMAKAGLEVIWENVTFHIKFRDKILVSMPATIDPRFATEVASYIKAMNILTRHEDN